MKTPLVNEIFLLTQLSDTEWQRTVNQGTPTNLPTSFNPINRNQISWKSMCFTSLNSSLILINSNRNREIKLKERKLNSVLVSAQINRRSRLPHRDLASQLD